MMRDPTRHNEQPAIPIRPKLSPRKMEASTALQHAEGDEVNLHRAAIPAIITNARRTQPVLILLRVVLPGLVVRRSRRQSWHCVTNARGVRKRQLPLRVSRVLLLDSTHTSPTTTVDVYDNEVYQLISLKLHALLLLARETVSTHW